MKCANWILPVLLLTSGWLCGQGYDRSSVSLILMDYKDALQEQVYGGFSVMQLGDRYDKNRITTDLILYSGSREYKVKNPTSGEMEIATPDRTSTLTKYLNGQNVGLQVIGYIYNRQENGFMNAEVVNQRAAYNKTDVDYNVLKAMKRNLAGLQEGGEKLINNSYIMVYDYANLRYEYEEDKSTGEADFYWKATPAIYLFRVNFTDELRQQFYDECWMDEETPAVECKARRERFAAFRVPVRFVMRYSITRNVPTGIVDFRKKTKEERGNMTEEDLKAKSLNSLVRGSFQTLSEKIEEKNTEFQVKTAVENVKPVRAKIGLKEGVKTNQRYFMYEYSEGGNGEIKRTRKGIIRATSEITDNRQVTSGNTEPTKFYQIAGRAAQPGWEMHERKSLGMNLEAGYQMGNLNGVAFGITGSTYGRKNLNHYFLFDFVYGLDTYKIDWWSKSSGSYVKTVNYNLMVVNLGYGYGLMKRNWELYPYIGAGANMLMDDEKKEDKDEEILDNTEEDKKDDSKFMDEMAWMFNCGVRLTLNIRYPVQLFGGIEYSTAVYKGKTYNALCIQKDLDKASSGIHYKLGLRYCF